MSYTQCQTTTTNELRYNFIKDKSLYCQRQQQQEVLRERTREKEKEERRKAREATVTKSIAYFLGPLPGKNQASDIFMKLIQKARQEEG